jgi:hypothetical protein
LYNVNLNTAPGCPIGPARRLFAPQFAPWQEAADCSSNRATRSSLAARAFDKRRLAPIVPESL